MATVTTNTVLDHTSDAGFRAWVAEVIDGLIAVGVTQTADAGQINPATVTRPAVNTTAGYAVFRFNDAAHGTNPIFFRLNFGTGSSASSPRLNIILGQGSNGSGTITGIVTPECACFASGTVSSTVTNYPTRICYNAARGFLGFVFKIGALAGSHAYGGFVISRSNDANGDPTTDSFVLISNSYNSTGGSNISGTFSTAISHLTSLQYVFPTPSAWAPPLPYGVTSTLYAGNNQVGPVWQYTPVLGISNNLAIALNSEIGLHATAVLTLVGAASHTYINVGTAFGQSSSWGPNLGSSTHGLMMLWE